MSYFINRDRIQMGSSSSGTGNLILTYSVSGYQNLQSVSATTTNNQIYYSVSDGVNFEIGIGRFVASGERPPNVPLNSTTAVLIRDEVLESSANTNARINFSSAIKNVSLVFPANVTVGSAATGDNSSIGTNLNAWNNLKKELYRRIARGNPFDNRGVGGIVSTYSLIYPPAGVPYAYSGGVLAINQDIHFVPYFADRGQKVSSTGVVSTYSLVYTTTDAYEGGVLAPNGDIHFVPRSANRGQKISASGVVSTYSLVYTTPGAYNGGVVAPNGDIHFVPSAASGANRGQKISITGVVSTYSLIVTTGSYAGGVLAPNGDIYFVPSTATVGQKIDINGVVSTYTLIHAISAAYYGGVLAPNGDIHFIPYNARVGQKTSQSGVVSTYSLAYTTLSAYIGGVLAPNGDIHFVPYSANRGQKISVTGVVSTYSLVFTVGGAYTGGILNPNGEIHFVPYSTPANPSAIPGQKIATGINTPIGHCVSPFFNKY